MALDRENLRGLFALLRPWRARYAAAMAASMVSMSFGGAFPWLVGRMWDAALPSAKLRVGAWQPDVNTVGTILIVTLIIQAALTFFSSYSFNKVGESAVVSLRRQLFARLLAMPMKFFGEHRVGELTSRLSNDLAQIHDVLTFTVASTIRQTMLLLIGLVAISLTSLKLAAIMLASFPVLMLVARVCGRRVRAVQKAAQDRLADGATILEETLQGVANVKSFTNEAYEERRYAGALEKYLAQILRGARFRAGLIAFVILGIFGSIVLVLWEGGRMMQSGELSHGELSTFVLYTILIGTAVSSMSEIFGQVQKAIGATERVRELLGEAPEPASGSTARLAGEVRFEDVHFSYPSRADLPVLRGVSLAAQRGEKIALVGPSGAGKSTIVSLLLRFYEPDAGYLFIDGADARSIALGTLRGGIAIVPQEVLLFGGSIRENIAYGRPGATNEEIRTAASRANCEEFIARFPEGYETLVGDRGVKLSGGQRQRIAIARALLRDPAILVLDEATSSLDSESESLIQQALAELLRGRTAIIIAHRLATVRAVDRIYVIEEGRVTEVGAHSELMVRENGTYRRLAEMQFVA